MSEDFSEDQLLGTLDVSLMDGSRYELAFEVMMSLLMNKIKQIDKQIEILKQCLNELKGEI